MMGKYIGRCAYHTFKRHLLDLSVRDWGQSIMMTDGTLNCKHCDSPYTTRRSTKLFCSDKCRVYHNRSTQNSQHSPTKRRENMEYFDRANYALELYRECGSNYREQWLQDYIDNPTTKKIVCNPSLLHLGEVVDYII